MNDTINDNLINSQYPGDTPRVLALGMFDGVHRGHQTLIEEAVRLAKEKNAVPSVYTFSNHPMTLFGKKPEYLTSITERDGLLLQSGAKEVLSDSFDETLRDMAPEAFLNMLLTRFHAVGLVAGFNYTFGSRAMGTPALLKQWGENHNISVSVMPEVRLEGVTVSSSGIRSALTERGDVTLAGKLLARPYVLTGTVVHGLGNGRKINFPTLNLDAQSYANRVLPLNGVYATVTAIGDISYSSVTNIGKNPTFGATDTTVETHIIGEAGDCYGKTLSVGFKKRLRGEITFASADELKAQIAKDILAAGE